MNPSPDKPSPPQVQFGTLLNHPAAPCIAATACLFLAMVLPLATVAANLGGLPLGAVGLTGGLLFGVFGWLAVVVLAAAAATRLALTAAPYRSIVDIVGLATWAGLAAWALVQAANPVPPEVGAVLREFGGIAGPGGAMAQTRRAVQQVVSVTPSFGALPFVAAGALVLFSAWRSRRVPATAGITHQG